MTEGPRPPPTPLAPPEPGQPGAGASAGTEDEAAWNDERSPLWTGIPAEVVRRPGAYDHDSAGGCG